MQRFAVAALACLLLPLAACSSLRQLGAVAFTAASMSDVERHGALTNKCVSVDWATQLGNAAQAPTAAFAEIGCVMGVTAVGEEVPDWVYCPPPELQKKCAAIPSNAVVTFYGQPLGRTGRLWLPSRVTWSER